MIDFHKFESPAFTNPPVLILIYLFISLLGFVPFAIVLYKMSKAKALKRGGVKAVGVVRSMSASPGSSISTVTVEYYLKDLKYTVSKQVKVGGMPYKIGQELPLYYEKKNPHNMVLDSGKAAMVGVILALLLAMLCIGICFLINNSIANGEL